MIKTVSGKEISRFLSAAFIDLMSHFCNTDKITPCEGEKCELTEEEWSSIPKGFVEETIDYAIPAFDEVGGMDYIRKKVAQLVKIAKAEDEIQLDLVSELILFLIGENCGTLSWKDENGIDHYPDEPIDYPQRSELLDDSFADEFEDKVMREEFYEDTEAVFESFYTLMNADQEFGDYVFYDDDYSFMLEDNIPDGMHKLYKAVSDYSREWYMRSWTDIGEEVPPVVVYELDAVEVEAINFGGLEKMRAAYAESAMRRIAGIYNDEKN